MFKDNHILLLLVLVLTLGGCKKKQESNDIIIRKPQMAQTAKKAGPMALPAEERQQVVSWLGTQYTVTIKRKADKELPLCDNGTTKAYDNRVYISVMRKDGTTFYSHSFTRKDFTSRVSLPYPKGSALLSVYLDKAEGDNLLFVASIGLPDALSDEYIPLRLKLSRMGSVSVEKMAME